MPVYVPARRRSARTATAGADAAGADCHCSCHARCLPHVRIDCTVANAALAPEQRSATSSPKSPPAKRGSLLKGGTARFAKVPDQAKVGQKELQKRIRAYIAATGQPMEMQLEEHGQRPSITGKIQVRLELERPVNVDLPALRSKTPDNVRSSRESLDLQVRGRRPGAAGGRPFLRRPPDRSRWHGHACGAGPAQRALVNRKLSRARHMSKRVSQAKMVAAPVRIDSFVIERGTTQLVNVSSEMRPDDVIGACVRGLLAGLCGRSKASRRDADGCREDPRRLRDC